MQHEECASAEAMWVHSGLGTNLVGYPSLRTAAQDIKSSGRKRGAMRKRVDSRNRSGLGKERNGRDDAAV
jgi:hypothetical protein